MANYMFSGWPFGTYSNEWDFSSAVGRKEMRFADYVPLVQEVKKGDRCYLRQYSRGIFAKAEVGNIEWERDVAVVTLDNLDGLYSLIPQDAFFVKSSNQNMRSRIIRISDEDAEWIDRLNERKEQQLFTEADKNSTLAARLKVRHEVKRRVLWGS